MIPVDVHRRAAQTGLARVLNAILIVVSKLNAGNVANQTGSSKIGKQCRIGGQAGFVGHIEVADGTQVQAQSGMASEVQEAGQAFYGSPAIPYRDYLRSYAVFKKLPELYRRISDLEKRLKNYEG